MATSTGLITGDTIVRPATEPRGIVTYAEAATAVMKLYSGTTAGGTLLATIPIGGSVTFNNPVEFKDGLFAAAAGGTGVIHIG